MGLSTPLCIDLPVGLGFIVVTSMNTGSGTDLMLAISVLAALGSGLVAFAALFLPWTVLSADDPVIQEALNELPAGQVVRNAWDSGWQAGTGMSLHDVVELAAGA